MQKFILTGIFSLAFFCTLAQLSPKDSAIFAPLIGISYSYNWPGGDLVDRFGGNSTIGGAVSVKTRTNWMFGINYSYIFGNNVKEVGLFDNLITGGGFIIDEDGTPSETDMWERGFMLAFKIGKVFTKIPFTGFALGRNPNSGLIIGGGAGFMQHKIRIESNATQLDGDYKKGYDRLSNGPSVNEFIGYFYIGNSRLVNFYIGFESIQAWTQNRRGYNYDTMKEDHESRIDIMSGVKAGWMLPLYKKLPDQYYFY